MYSNTPPVPPPKPPASQDVSRISTPSTGEAPRHPPFHDSTVAELGGQPGVGQTNPSGQELEDPGDKWLPKFLEDKS
jgi:hypothetical protein